MNTKMNMDTLARQQSGKSSSPSSPISTKLIQNNSLSTDSSLLSSTTNCERHFCVVCGDESDGLHFGQYTCRACAAFFRRTVSLKLQYSCKHDRNCVIEKSARNMCRSCRFEKCLQQGMLTSAVQHSRDGLGKRKEVEKLSASSSETPDIKIPKAVELQNRLVTIQAASMSSVPNVLGQLYTPNYTAQSLSCMTPPPLQTYSSPTTSSANTSMLGQATAATILHLNGGVAMANNFGFSSHTVKPIEYETGKTAPPSYMVNNFANLQLSNQNIVSGSAFTALLNDSPSSALIHPEMKYLSRMLEGYQHFLSLRKASYTLVEGLPRFRQNEEIIQSNFGTSKKICKIEASLIMDTVEKFFIPFNTLPSNDKNLLFDSFYCLFSNTERAFRTYKMFGANDDRLLMPDGGYIKLSELEKFYENNSLVRGDPQQVAKIFESAMEYVVNVVVAHMRNISITEVELMCLFGMFIWKDTLQLPPETMAVVLRTRDNILIDLHAYYRSLGLVEAEITIKTANLFFLMPKLEHSYKLMKENFHIAELFNMMDGVPCENLLKTLRLV